METNKPIETVRRGNVKAAIWANEGSDGEFYSFTLARVYKAEAGLKDSKSFGWRDVWPMIRVLTSVYTFLADKNREAQDSQHEAA